MSDQGQRSVDRVTDRAVRSVVRLFNVEDTTWRQDMALVEALVKDLGVEYQNNKPGDTGVPAESLPCFHCCSAHCSLLGHPVRPVQPKVPEDGNKFEIDGVRVTYDEENEDQQLDVVSGDQDSFTGVIGCLGMDIVL